MAEGDVVILQGGVIKEFLYLDRGRNSKKEEEKGGKKDRRSGGRRGKSLYISITTRENVERTKQMNRREEGMITTKMIIFNQNHDNNNK